MSKVFNMSEKAITGNIVLKNRIDLYRDVDEMEA